LENVRVQSKLLTEKKKQILGGRGLKKEIEKKKKKVINRDERKQIIYL